MAFKTSYMANEEKKICKLGSWLAPIGKVWIEDGYVIYRGTYGGHFKVRLADIQIVNADMGGRSLSTKAILRLIGGGVDLAAVEMNRLAAEQARDWILANKGS